MRTSTQTLIAVASVVAFLGVGLASAEAPSNTTDPAADGSGTGAPQHQGWLAKLRAHLRFFHRHPAAAMEKACDGNMTVDECKALLKDKVQELKDKVQQKAEQAYEQCLTKRSKDYCDGRLDQFKADHPRLYGNQTADPTAA